MLYLDVGVGSLRKKKRRLSDRRSRGVYGWHPVPHAKGDSIQQKYIVTCMGITYHLM